MEALEIEGQTDQTPLARCRRDPTQGELAEAEHLFDDADYRFDRAFAYPIDRFAQRGSQLVGHLDLCAGVLRWWIGQRREPLLPTGMMGITTRGDVGLDAAFGTRCQGGRAKVASIQRRRLGSTDRRWNGGERGFSFLAIIGMIGEGPSHDEQTGLIHRHLRVIILLEARMGRAFHDARLRVGLDRDTARPHSLRSARFRIPSTEPAVQVGCNGLSTVLRLSFGLIPTVIRIQTSHSSSDMDCCHPSPQSSHELAFMGTMMALTSRTSIKRSYPSPYGQTFRLSQ